MGFGVSERPQTFVIFLAGCIPEGQLNGFAVYSAVGYVVLKHRRDLISNVNGWIVASAGWFDSHNAAGI
jgi:hypothetical protein